MAIGEILQPNFLKGEINLLDKNREQEIYLELSEAINNCYKNNSIQNAEKVRQLINKSSILGDYDNKDIKCIKFVFNPNVYKPFF